MKYKGTLIVVKDCKKALKFYQDLFGFKLVKDNDGNMKLSNNLYLQEEKYWKQFINSSIFHKNNCTELYFEEENIEKFVEKLEKLYPTTEFLHKIKIHSWGQKAIRFYDLDKNLIEVATPL